jgi:sporulation protein YlmC with PRC-barrel domain
MEEQSFVRARCQITNAVMECKMMSKLLAVAAAAATLTAPAYAQQSHTTGAAPPSQAQTLTTLPPDASTVTNWYKQNVYDPSDTKIGEIKDVLVSKDGKINAFIVSAGGFLGAGEKDVAVPFDQVHGTERNGKWWLTMNTTKDALKNATGYKYDKTKATWVPA